MNRLIFALIVLMISHRATAGGSEFRIAPTGDDGADGSATAPFATVARAQKAVRALLQQDRIGPINIVIHGGAYQLAAPLAFTSEDSGSGKFPVTYRAAEGEHPVLSGGVRIIGWKVDDKGWWHVTLPEVKSGAWNFEQLFVNDQRRFRPRMPRQGYYRIASSLPPSKDVGERRGKPAGHNRFTFTGADLRGDWANFADVEVCTMHVWAMSRMHIAAIDAEQRVVKFAGHTDGLLFWAAFPKGHRYFVENVKEALSAPGEWYLDRPTGELIYIPMPGEKPESAVVIAPRLEQLVTFSGAEHITLQGLDFAHANWTLPAEGQTFPQAEVNLRAAVSLAAARHITIRDCAVRHVGQYAIAIGSGCSRNVVEGCELFDLGAGGVKIGDLEGKQEVTQNTVRNCTIAHGGRIHPAGEGVWIGPASGNVVDHNDIFDFYYTGVSVGWSWGYGPSPAHHNRVTNNRIHTIGQALLSDMAGVYTLGISPGTVVSGNVIHDIDAFDYGGWGLYTDEGSTDIEMSGNLVYRTKTGGFHQHYGRDNKIVNNIFVDAKVQQLERTRVEGHNSFFFQRNIICWTGATPVMKGNWADKITADHNLYWCAGGAVKFPGDLALEQWRGKTHQETGSIVADPLFIDAAHDDYRLKGNSPAIGMGHVPADFSKAGPASAAQFMKDLPTPPRAFP